MHGRGVNAVMVGRLAAVVERHTQYKASKAKAVQEPTVHSPVCGQLAQTNSNRCSAAGNMSKSHAVAVQSKHRKYGLPTADMLVANTQDESGLVRLVTSYPV